MEKISLLELIALNHPGKINMNVTLTQLILVSAELIVIVSYLKIEGHRVHSHAMADRVFERLE